MNNLRRLGVLALPVVAAASLIAPASAAPATGSPHAAADCLNGVRSYIANYKGSEAGAGIGVGVISTWTKAGSVYAKGLYDEVLPVNQRTDCRFGWYDAEGYYIGPGYCAALWAVSVRGKWYIHKLDIPPGQHKLEPLAGRDVQRWDVQAYRC